MTPSLSPRDATILRESAAADDLADLIGRLEVAGDRLKGSAEVYYRDVWAREQVMAEAHDAGLSQELIAEFAKVSGGQPEVSRILKRYRERGGKRTAPPMVARVRGEDQP